jgi:predicted exporter
MRVSRILPAFWLVLVIASLSGGATLLPSIRFESSILALLPATEQDLVLRHVVDQRTSEGASRIVLSFEGNDRDAVHTAAVRARALLEHKELVAPSVSDTIVGERFYELYFPHRYRFLDPSVATLLRDPAGVPRLFQEIARELHSPVAGLGTLLESDPLLLFPRFLRTIAVSHAPENQDGVMHSPVGTVHRALLVLQVLGSGLDRNVQERVSTAIEGEVAALTPAGATFRWTGFIRFAHEASHSMRRELTLMSIGSSIALLLLMWCTFRSALQIVITFAALAIGTFHALLVCHLLFPSVHLITLAFGSSLTGVAVDYAFHFFAHYRISTERWDSWEAMRELLPGLTYGMATTIAGYLALAFTPFPGLQQMAVFSTVSVISAYGTVVCLFPAILRTSNYTETPWLFTAGQQYLSWCREVAGSRSRKALLLAVLTVAALGITVLQTDDDVRVLHAAPPELRDDERLIRESLGGVDATRYFVVRGSSRDEVLHRERALVGLLEQARGEQLVGETYAISRFYVPEEVQRANLELLHTVLATTSGIGERFEQIGLDRSHHQFVLEELERERGRRGLDLDSWLTRFPLRDVTSLWRGMIQGEYATLVLLAHVHDVSEILRRSSRLPGVAYVDTAAQISGLLKRSRLDATEMVIYAYIAILCVFALRYGVRRALMVLFPAAAAAAVCIGLLGWFGYPLHLMHLFALLLVLSIGVDYAVYFAEGEGMAPVMMFAVILSAAATVLAFGMLCISTHPVLEALGVVVVPGILVSFLLAPIVVVGDHHA